MSLHYLRVSNILVNFSLGFGRMMAFSSTESISLFNLWGSSNRTATSASYSIPVGTEGFISVILHLSHRHVMLRDI